MRRMSRKHRRKRRGAGGRDEARDAVSAATGGPGSAEGASVHGAPAGGADGDPKTGAGAASRVIERPGRPEEPPEGADEPRERRTAFDSFRENAEALIVAVILAIIIRHFAVEAFEIPTGSMASTLYGMHVWTDCPNCDTSYNIAVSTDSSTGEVRTGFSPALVYTGDCPNPSCELDRHTRDRNGRQQIVPGGSIRCQACKQDFRGDPQLYETFQALELEARCPICHLEYRAVARDKDVRGGNKILVNKFAYQLGKPERWDVIVFEFDQWKNYIKRLVGRPGETIHIFDGDVYADGKIVRKSLHPYVQEVMWKLVSDSDVAERGLNRVPAWSPPSGQRSNLWDAQRGGTRWSINHPGGGEPAALEYQRGFDNYVSYNLMPRRPGESGKTRGDPADVQVGDRKVEFLATPVSGDGWLGAEIRDGEFAFRVRLPIGEASSRRPAVLERVSGRDGSIAAGEVPLRIESAHALPLHAATRVELENVDDRVAVRLDGEEILAIDYVSCPDIYDRPAPAGRLRHAHHLRILGSGVQATLDSVRVYQDIYYLSPPECHGSPSSRWNAGGGIRLREGEYLALGDNSASSSDSRYWGHVPETNLMGKALVVFWPAWPLNFQCKFIR